MRILSQLPVLILLLNFVADATAQQAREVHLAGYNHHPTVHTHGTGMVEVTIVSDTLIVSGQFTDLMSTYWTAGIFYGRERESGNRLLRLTAELNEDKRSGHFPAEENRFVLPQGIRDALREGRLYVNISSQRYQRGEIRGQIPPMN